MMRAFALSLAGLAFSAPGGAAIVSATVEPATVQRGDPVIVTVRTTERVPGDRVGHYMLWTQRQPVPNPLRVEGDNYILGDHSPDGAFPLDVSWWPDGVYTLSGRAYYFAKGDDAFVRLDTSVKLRVQGGPLPPKLVVKPAATDIRPGEPLRLSLDLQNGEPLGAFVEASVVSRGQQVTQEIPLDRQEVELAVVRPPQAPPTVGGAGGAEVILDTTGWRPQVLRCLMVRARYRMPGRDDLCTLVGTVPPVTVLPREGTPDPRVQLSYRGGRPIHLITNDASMNTFPYPTCVSWRNNGREVFFETDRPRPDGTVVKGERQLMMADVETGRLTHLATLGVEDAAAYGAFHLPVSRQFHSDYAPEADLLVYYDMSSHRMYTLRPGGQPVEVLHEKHGCIGDPPAISRDGRRILYYVIAPGPNESRYFTGMTSAIFTLEIDPRTGAATEAPRMVHAWPWRKSPPSDGPASFGATIGCDHVQFCPADTRKIMYAHEGGFARNGEPENTRIWHIRDDGTENHALAPAQEKGKFYTHEVYGPLGRYVYTVWSGSVARIEVATNRFECVYEAQSPLRACHIAVGPDEKWVAADMLSGFGADNDNNGIGGLFFIEVATGKATFLAAFPAGAGHPRHVHPNFSPDGRKVGFSLAQGRSQSQIAYVDVSDIVAAGAGSSRE